MRSPTSVAGLLLHRWVDVVCVHSNSRISGGGPPEKKKRGKIITERRIGRGCIRLCVHTSPLHALGLCQHGLPRTRSWRNDVPLKMTSLNFAAQNGPMYVCLTAVPRSKSGPPAKSKVGKNYHRENRERACTRLYLTRSPLRETVVDKMITPRCCLQAQMETAAQDGPMCAYVPFAPPTHGSHDRHCTSLQVAPRRLQLHDATR